LILAGGGNRGKQTGRNSIATRLLDGSLIAPAVFGARNFVEQLLKIDLLIPDVERRHGGELAEVLAVGTNGRANGVFAMARFGARGATRDFDTDDQPLEIPFPRRR